MHFLKRLFDFVLFGNIYVALGTVCLVQSTSIQLGLNDHLFFYSALAFFATLFIYNLQRLFYSFQKDSTLLSIRRKWIFENQLSTKTLSALGFTGVIITFYFNDYKIVFYLLPLLILSIAYFLPFIKLRKNPWFKLFTLAIVWTTVTVIIPSVLCNIDLFSINFILHFFVRLTFIIAICIPFDIRDMKIDKAENIFTIPQRFGENKARWTAFGFMLLNILLIAGEFISEMFTVKIFIALMITAIINAAIVFMSSSKRSEYFYTALLDGTMILQGVLIMLAAL